VLRRCSTRSRLWQLRASATPSAIPTRGAKKRLRSGAVRDLSFETADDFFQATIRAQVERSWEEWLGQLVPALPTYERVIGELRPMVDEILAEGW